MSEHNYSYTDDNLDLGQAHTYNLLLQVEAKSFNYIITDNTQLLAWAENCALKELSSPDYLRDVLTANYNSIIVGLSSTGFTLVPKDLFDAGHIADLARLLDVQDNEKVYSQFIDDQNAIVYKVNQDISAAVASTYTDNVNHKAKGWITAIVQSHPNDNTLYLNVANEKVQFLYFSNRKLRFYNNFTFSNHEELAYYAAFVTEELGLNAHDLNLILSGDVNRTDKYFTYLADFFGSVKLSELQVLDIPAQLEPHKLLTLAALSLCASSEEN